MREKGVSVETVNKLLVRHEARRKKQTSMEQHDWPELKNAPGRRFVLVCRMKETRTINRIQVKA